VLAVAPARSHGFGGGAVRVHRGHSSSNSKKVVSSLQSHQLASMEAIDYTESRILCD